MVFSVDNFIFRKYSADGTRFSTFYLLFGAKRSHRNVANRLRISICYRISDKYPLKCPYGHRRFLYICIFQADFDRPLCKFSLSSELNVIGLKIDQIILVTVRIACFCDVHWNLFTILRPEHIFPANRWSKVPCSTSSKRFIFKATFLFKR